MTIRVRTTVRNLNEAIRKLDDIFDKLEGNRHGALYRATNKVADEWRKNFDSEGQAVGGWAQLAEKTQQIRAEQGFDPEHPILFRYGDLRGVAIEMHQSATGSVSQSKTDGQGKRVSGSLDLKDGVAVLQAHGWKVANQWGYSASNGAGRTPARPFWFVDNNVIAAARKGVVDWLLDEVVK